MIKKLMFFLLLADIVLAQEEKVIYEYKKYERIDLGDLEVKGQLIAPGDLSVRERDRKRLEIPLYRRTDVNDIIRQDIKTLR